MKPLKANFLWCTILNIGFAVSKAEPSYFRCQLSAENHLLVSNQLKAGLGVQDNWLQTEWTIVEAIQIFINKPVK